MVRVQNWDFGAAKSQTLGVGSSIVGGCASCVPQCRSSEALSVGWLGLDRGAR